MSERKKGSNKQSHTTLFHMKRVNWVRGPSVSSSKSRFKTSLGSSRNHFSPQVQFHQNPPAINGSNSKNVKSIGESFYLLLFCNNNFNTSQVEEIIFFVDGVVSGHWNENLMQKSASPLTISSQKKRLKMKHSEKGSV